MAKRGKMTEEEKELYLQTQEDMDLRKEKTVAQFLQDKLHEDERGTVLQRLNEGWRTRLRLCESEQQRNQKDILKQTWERELDAIDSYIQDLTDELREKEHHLGHVHRCYLSLISQLSELQQKRTGVLQQEWRTNMNKIQKYHTLQREQSSQDSLQSLDPDPAPSAQDKYEDQLREIECSFRLNTDYKEKILHDKKENFMKKSRVQLRECLQELEKAEQELEEVTFRNRPYREALGRASKALETEKKKLGALQSEHSLDELDEAKMKEHLADEESQHVQLRRNFKRDQSTARNKLTELSVQSEEAASAIKSLITQGERVLRMTLLCRRMEERLLLTQDLQTLTEDTEAERCELPELSLLTRLHSEAVAQRLVLRQQRNALRCLNQQLRGQVQDLRQDRDTLQVRGTGPAPAQVQPGATAE